MRDVRNANAAVLDNITLAEQIRRIDAERQGVVEISGMFVLLDPALQKHAFSPRFSQSRSTVMGTDVCHAVL